MDNKNFAVCSREYGTVMIVELSDYDSELHLNEFIRERKVIELCGPLTLEPVDYLKEESLKENSYGKVLADSPFRLSGSMEMKFNNGKIELSDRPNDEDWKKYI